MTEKSATIKRALLSVSDKTRLVDLAQALHAREVELVSTGGTAKMLREAGLPVVDVADLTGFPEMMDGRVKTLHPAVHGGLLALRDNPDHLEAMQTHGIGGIDLLVVNLYPFEQTVAQGGDYQTCVENIDIGGPAMIRAAAKNHAHVAVIVDVEDYTALLDEMDATDGAPGLAFRQGLTQTAYARTAAYDAAVSTWLAGQIGDEAPRRRSFGGQLAQTLRYGENPHQAAAFYTDGSNRPGAATARQWQGKELSYNNLNDTDAAFELVAEFDPADGPACVIVKHANPCGVAVAGSLQDAYQAAFDCDRVSAFGGIVALNQPLDEATARMITEIFTEVVIAPGASEEALAVFAARKNLRLLTTEALPDAAAPGLMMRQISGGFLVQDKDTGRISEAELKVVTEKAPDPDQMRDLLFAWKVAKHVKSNAIVYARNQATVGVGAGQMSRVDSALIAAKKAERMAETLNLAEPLTKGSAVASDAFFPFPDGLLEAAAAGASCVIQPGGSLRDDEVIAAANEAGLAMVFTGMRHFRH
ncbi:bifunctional phosphoribosylaminoimidazolecarboxamide formyltransferase/IMP cyclohydrolase [Halovulum sp. GXIMD14793]